MKLQRLQTLPPSLRVRDATFLNEDTLLFTDSSANVQQFSLKHERITLLHRGEDVLAPCMKARFTMGDRDVSDVYHQSFQQLTGLFPSLGVSPRGDALLVAIKPYVYVGWSATHDAWRFLAMNSGFYSPPEFVFSPDGNRCAVLTEGATEIFELPSLNNPFTLETGSCAWHPSRSALLCVGDNNELCAIDPNQPGPLDSYQQASLNKPLVSLSHGEESQSESYHIALLHDGTFTSFSDVRSFIDFWQLEPLQPLARVELKEEPLRIVGAPGQPWFAVEGRTRIPSGDAQRREYYVQLWDTASRAAVSEMLLNQTDIRFSPSGRRFVTFGMSEVNPNPYPRDPDPNAREQGRPVLFWEIEA
ncbi:hypothetical protein F0U61_03390 [Archangium violaceum]|uniref:hypothetical protein n=1 Tax=Archangium violaceum TaxID=83451 RepID=UPI002B3153B3|nr:hypothetical protein F0U61_03390 [Archangium violaceum]